MHFSGCCKLYAKITKNVIGSSNEGIYYLNKKPINIINNPEVFMMVSSQN